MNWVILVNETLVWSCSVLLNEILWFKKKKKKIWITLPLLFHLFGLDLMNSCLLENQLYVILLYWKMMFFNDWTASKKFPTICFVFDRLYVTKYLSWKYPWCLCSLCSMIIWGSKWWSAVHGNMWPENSSIIVNQS